jgi:thioredoxin 1
VNTEADPAAGQAFRIQAIPTLLFFKSGQMVEQMVGIQPEKEIRSRLDNLLK